MNFIIYSFHQLLLSVINFMQFMYNYVTEKKTMFVGYLTF